MENPNFLATPLALTTETESETEMCNLNHIEL